MSVHYKFKSALDYDTVTFDGLHISVGDLKAAISQQKRIGKTSDFDLQITNAQTKEVYVDDNTLIPKNTSLLVARVPLAQQPKKHWEGFNNNSTSVQKDVAPNKGVADLSRMEGSEQDKINAMISQSTYDYDPSNYQKFRGQNQRGIVPANYTCYRCKKGGHWIKDCPIALSGDSLEIRRSTGIPRSFMVAVEGPQAPGAMITPSGTYAVPAVDRDAYMASENSGEPETAGNAPVAPEPSIPDELICSLCRDLLTDAVMIPCCGNSFCDECIRGALLESEDHECPDCREKEISPTTLIPNRFLRNSVSSFRNQTGYSRRTPHRPSVVPPVQVLPPPAEIPLHIPPPNVPVQPLTSGPPQTLKPPGMETPPNIPIHMQRPEEQRSSTPTVDERRDPMSQNMYNRGPPPPFMAGVPPPQRFDNRPYGRPPPGRHHRMESYPRGPYQPPPPGIKDSPTNGQDEDPLEAFNRMIREKEMRAKRREEERRRAHSGSRSPHSRPRSRSRSRSRTPRSRIRSPPPARPRFSRSRSISRGRVRGRSPWSPRRHRSRERSLSLPRSQSPPRRHRSPLRYRTPLRSPPRSSPRTPLRSPLRSPLRHSAPRSPLRSSPRSPLRSPPRSPIHSPRRDPLRSPRPTSPHRYTGVYDELLSPRRSDPPYGPRYGPRTNVPPPQYAPLGGIPNVIPMKIEPQIGYRGRYNGPPFEDIPPGVDPPVPGYEPPHFDKPPFGPPGVDRERAPNFRDTLRPPPYVEGTTGYREMTLPTVPGEVPVHVGEHPSRYRDNYRPGGPIYRDQGPVPYRDPQLYRDKAQPQQHRDGGYRGGPPPSLRDSNIRNHPYRDGVFRENVTHNFRDGPPAFRPPSADPREPPPLTTFHENFRDGYNREDPNHLRSGFRPRGRGSSRRNPNLDHERHRERETRDRERYIENRDPTDRSRDVEKRSGYEKNRDAREGREERSRDYDRNRDNEKERDRDHDRATPEKKPRMSPKRNREARDKKRSESRGQSRDRDRDAKREKKDERVREKSADRNKDHKEKDKKIKERKKKKKEKEKESEKKKKREKKDKKDKESIKKEDEEIENSDIKSPKDEANDLKESGVGEAEQEKLVQPAEPVSMATIVKKESFIKIETKAKPRDDLYGEEAAGAIDKEIIQNYVKAEDGDVNDVTKNNDSGNKDEPFDGLELQAPADELDLKADLENTNDKEMLAPLPVLSKWEVEDDNIEKKEPGELSSPDEEEDEAKVTSEVIKRAENAIFAKAISSLRPIEIKKISSDRLKLYGDESQSKNAMSNIQITVPIADSEQRSIEINERKRRHSKTPPPRLSVKERLGGKVEDVRKRESRVVQSTVERVKARSKTPKTEQAYRRVTVDRERGRKFENRIEPSKSDRRTVEKTTELLRVRSSSKETKRKDPNKAHKEGKNTNSSQTEKSEFKSIDADREKKKTTLDEAHFEPDYDETVESENESKDENNKKRENSARALSESKKNKAEDETITLNLTNVKKKPDSDSESSSNSEYSSSSTSSADARKRSKKKKKRSKKKRKRAASDSDSDSGSSSDDHKKKKKRRKHKKKSSKKKKKSKHK